MTRFDYATAVLYCRISESDDRSTSLARQESDLRRRAELSGWRVVAVLVDDGLSGTRSRANAERARAMLRTGEADVLATWKFDRYARTGLPAVAELITTLKGRSDAGRPALFWAEQDGLNSDQPAWRIIAAVLAEVAAMESANTSMRVRSFQRDAKRRGAWHGGMIPLGYATAPAPHGTGRVLVPEPREVAFLTEAAERIVGGASAYSVAAWLNASDFRPRKAARWSTQAVLRALTGSAIVGRVVADGDVIRNEDGLPRELFDPALPVDLWHKVRAVIEGRHRGRQKVGVRAPVEGEKRQARLLASFARCADCGAPLYTRMSSPGKGKAGVPIYACSARSNGQECGGVSVTASHLEALVEERFLHVVGGYEVVRPVEVDEPATDLREAEQALAYVEERLRDLDLDEDSEERLLGQRRGLRGQVRTLRAQAKDRAPSLRYESTGERFEDAWAAGDAADRRELLGSWLGAVYVTKGGRGRHGLDPARVRFETLVERDPAEAELDAILRTEA